MVSATPCSEMPHTAAKPYLYPRKISQGASHQYLEVARCPK